MQLNDETQVHEEAEDNIQSESRSYSQYFVQGGHYCSGGCPDLS